MKNNKNYSINPTFVSRLYEQLEKHKMSQSDLAATIEMTQPAISKYTINGAVPNAETLCKIADVFGVSTDYLLGLTPYETPEIAARSMAKELNLSSDALTGLIENLKCFQELTGTLSCEDTNRYMNNFLESSALSQLMFSGFLKVLTEDQCFVLSSIQKKRKKRLKSFLDKFRKNYFVYLKKKYKDVSIVPEEIIDDFCKEFSSFIPNEEREKLVAAESVTDTAKVLRYSNSELVRTYFSPYLKVISIYARGKFKEFKKEFVTTLVDQLNDEDNYEEDDI